MSDRSDRKDSFLGLYVTSETKEQVERTAEEEGVSISEWMRRRLREAGINRHDHVAAA